MNEGVPTTVSQPALPVAGRIAFVAGALLGASGIALAAFAAHAGTVLPDARHVAILRQGVEMQNWQALALLGAGALARHEGRVLPWAIALLIGGTLAFALGVDGLAIADLPTERLAPFGGAAIIGGWLLLAVGAVRAR